MWNRREIERKDRQQAANTAQSYAALLDIADALHARTNVEQDAVGRHVIEIQRSRREARSEALITHRAATWGTILQWLTLSVSIFALAFAGIAAVFTYQQMVSSQDQAKSAQAQVTEMQKQSAQIEKQMRVDQRPWIEFKLDQKKNLKITLIAGKPISFHVKMSNVGKTFTRQIFGFTIVEKLAVTQAPAEGGPSTTMSTGIMFPNESMEMNASFVKTNGTTNDPIMMTTSDINDWNAGKLYFIITGKVTYVDIFGVSHWTIFCNRVMSKSVTTPTRHCIEALNDADTDS